MNVNSTRTRIIGMLALAVALAFMVPDGGHAQVASDDLDAIIHGEKLAKLNCGTCHDTGLEGDSPHEKAPAFRDLGARRSMESIFEMLLLSQSPEHSDMPKFTITPEQADDIVEWISWVQPEVRGKRLVEANCAQCHASGPDGDSPYPAAIPFRNISLFYPVQALEEAFAERIESGHPAMPVFDVTIPQLRAIIAYIETLQE